MNYLYLCPFSLSFLFFTSSSSLKRQELATATDHKWLMRLRKTGNKKNPGFNFLSGETNEDCPGAMKEEWEGKGNHFGNAGLNTDDNDIAPTKLLRRNQYPRARKRAKSYLTRAGKRDAANWTTGDKRGTFYLARAGKRDISYLTRAGKRGSPNPTRAQRTDRSYLTRAGKRGTFYLTRAGKRSSIHLTEKKKDKSYLTRAGKRSAFDLELFNQSPRLNSKVGSIPKRT